MGVLEAGQSTPLYELYYLGGETSLRGWANRKFTEINNNPVGGNMKILSNMEIRFPLIWRLGGEIFLDGGCLASEISAITKQKYRWDAGLGLTLTSPLGPIRIDYARIINPRKGEIDNPWQIQVGILYAF